MRDCGTSGARALQGAGRRAPFLPQLVHQPPPGQCLGWCLTRAGHYALHRLACRVQHCTLCSAPFCSPALGHLAAALCTDTRAGVGHLWPNLPRWGPSCPGMGRSVALRALDRGGVWHLGGAGLSRWTWMTAAGVSEMDAKCHAQGCFQPVPLSSGA